MRRTRNATSTAMHVQRRTAGIRHVLLNPLPRKRAHSEYDWDDSHTAALPHTVTYSDSQRHGHTRSHGHTGTHGHTDTRAHTVSHGHTGTPAMVERVGGCVGGMHAAPVHAMQRPETCTHVSRSLHAVWLLAYAEHGMGWPARST